jgi:hypothetical protein
MGKWTMPGRSNLLNTLQGAEFKSHILLNVINVNIKYAYTVVLKDKTQDAVLHALESKKSTEINLIWKAIESITDNGKEFTNNKIMKWMNHHQIRNVLD